VLVLLLLLRGQKEINDSNSEKKKNRAREEVD
jgi:hypothetical protein